MKYLLALIALTFSAAAVSGGMLEQMASDGSLQKVAAPRFTDPAEAKAFAEKCRALAAELVADPSTFPQRQTLYRQALLAGEFLDGRPYILKTTKVPSVVKLREWIKAPVSDDVAYVKFYPSREAVPDFIRSAFIKDPGSKMGETQGLTIDGRYIAIIESKFPQLNQDVLSHEMVHAYLTLVPPKPLDREFQEGIAVYLSVGKEDKFYGREAGVPEGMVVKSPEQYRIWFGTYRYLEQKVGKEKLYEYIRKAVETGEPDPQMIGFGFARKKQMESKPKPPVKTLILGGAAVILAAGIGAGIWYARRKDDY